MDKSWMRDVERQMARMKGRIEQRPIIAAGSPSGAAVYRTIVILGGNAASIGNDLDGIVYISGPITLTQAYDPDTDTIYDDGLGRGQLYEDGVLVGNVLVRHNLPTFPAPVIEGRTVRVVGTTTVTFEDPPDPDVNMTAYLFDWV
jgi:hypothetical protein